VTKENCKARNLAPSQGCSVPAFCRWQCATAGWHALQSAVMVPSQTNTSSKTQKDHYCALLNTASRSTLYFQSFQTTSATKRCSMWLRLSRLIYRSVKNLFLSFKTRFLFPWLFSAFTRACFLLRYTVRCLISGFPQRWRREPRSSRLLRCVMIQKSAVLV